jgi:hypothetical protein
MNKIKFTDMFGIGSAIAAALGVAFGAQRRTGRTTRLIESVKDGDRIIAASGNEATRLANLLAQRGVNVSVAVIDPLNPYKLFELGTAQGRTIFDHTWVEMRYQKAISDAADQMTEMEDRLSGYDWRHRETQEKAKYYAEMLAGRSMLNDYVMADFKKVGDA